MSVDVPQRPSDARVLHQDLVRLAEQLRDGATALLIRDQSVGTSETAIAHGQRSIPKSVQVIPHGAVAASRGPTPPDSTFVYVIAASACTADLVVWL